MRHFLSFLRAEIQTANFPQKISRGGASLQLEKTFLIVGGIETTRSVKRIARTGPVVNPVQLFRPLDTVYEFDRATYDWVLREQVEILNKSKHFGDK